MKDFTHPEKRSFTKNDGTVRGLLIRRVIGDNVVELTEDDKFYTLTVNDETVHKEINIDYMVSSTMEAVVNAVVLAMWAGLT